MLACAVMNPLNATRSGADPSRREEFIQAAAASPTIAAKHDKEAWLNLYAEGARLEDPVGTPHAIKGRRIGRRGCELARFYDAFIAPSDIVMRSHLDLVCAKSVFRHVTIDTTNRFSGLQLSVPAILLYELCETAEGLKIQRMSAHWELSQMSRQVKALGLKGASMLLNMNLSMLRAQGPRWVLRYIQGAQQGIRSRGKQDLAGFPDPSARWQDVVFELPRAAACSGEEWLARGGRWQVEHAYSSGWTVAAVGTVAYSGAEYPAGWLADFDPETRKPRRVRIFHE